MRVPLLLGWFVLNGNADDGFENGPFYDTRTYQPPSDWHLGKASPTWGGLAGGAVVVKSGDASWGGLHSPAPGSHFVALHLANVWIDRVLAGLTPGHEYAISFLAAYQALGCGGPCGGPAELRLLIDGVSLSGSVDLTPKFTRREYKFVATTASATIRFSNEGTAQGKRSAFIDAVKVRATARRSELSPFPPRLPGCTLRVTLAVRLVGSGGNRSSMLASWSAGLSCIR